MNIMIKISLNQILNTKKKQKKIDENPNNHTKTNKQKIKKNRKKK